MGWEHVRSRHDTRQAAIGDSDGGGERKHFHYCLFVSGGSARSQQSIKVVRSVCDKYMGSNYSFAVVDVVDEPERALSERVYVTPTLIRYGPPPLRRFVGDFSSESTLAAKMELME